MPARSVTTRGSEALVLLAILVLLGVFGVWPGSGLDIRAGKQALVENWLLVCAAGLIRSRPLRYFTWWVLLGFLLHYTGESMVTAWRFLLAALTIEAIATHLHRPGWLLHWWRVLTLLHTGYCVLQWLGLDPLFRIDLGQGPALTGFLDNETTCMTYTAMTLPLFGAGWWRLALLPTLVVLCLGHSAGAAALAIGLLVLMAWRAGWKARLGAVALAVLAVGLYSAHIESVPAKARLEATGNRWPIWREAWKQANLTERARWLGYGPGQFGAQFRWRANPALPRDLRWDMSQNEVVGARYEFGIPGVLLAGWVACVWLCRAAQDPLSWQLWLGWLLGGLYLSAAHLAPLAVVGILAAGLREGARRRALA